ncbi:hypothetical protein M5K25_002884 [Dendrobium thyrsiflorum]|uniref:Uncharacterized protein n=1 Tax=Dendrobium thyrsiflorum TaxID=117978 RepID=A0ABD0VW15_DENTH
MAPLGPPAVWPARVLPRAAWPRRSGVQPAVKKPPARPSPGSVQAASPVQAQGPSLQEGTFFFMQEILRPIEIRSLLMTKVGEKRSRWKEVRLIEYTKNVGHFLGCMSEPCSMTLTCVEEVERIHQGCRTFPRLYVRALLDDVNLCGRGRIESPWDRLSLIGKGRMPRVPNQRTIVGGPVRAWGHLKSGQKFGVTWKLSGSPASLGGQAKVRHHLEAGQKSGVIWRPGGDPALLGGRGEVRRHLEAGRRSGVTWRPGGSPASLGGRAELRCRLEAGQNSGVAWRPGGDPTLLGGREELRRRLEAGGNSSVAWRPGGTPASLGGRGELRCRLEAGQRSGLTWRPWGSLASLGGRAKLRRRLEAGGKSSITWRPGGTPALLGGRGEVRRHLEAGRNSGVAWRPGGTLASLGGRAEIRPYLEAVGKSGVTWRPGGTPASLGGRGKSGVAWRPGRTPASLGGRAKVRRRLTIRRWSRRSFFPPFLLLFPSPSSSLGPWSPLKRNEGSIYRFMRVAWLVNKGEIRGIFGVICAGTYAGNISDSIATPASSGGTPASDGSPSELRRQVAVRQNSDVRWRSDRTPAVVVEESPSPLLFFSSLLLLLPWVPFQGE